MLAWTSRERAQQPPPTASPFIQIHPTRPPVDRVLCKALEQRHLHWLFCPLAIKKQNYPVALKLCPVKEEILSSSILQCGENSEEGWGTLEKLRTKSIKMLLGSSIHSIYAPTVSSKALLSVSGQYHRVQTLEGFFLTLNSRLLPQGGQERQLSTPQWRPSTIWTHNDQSISSRARLPVLEPQLFSCVTWGWLLTLSVPHLFSQVKWSECQDRFCGPIVSTGKADAVHIVTIQEMEAGVFFLIVVLINIIIWSPRLLSPLCCSLI